ncbi:MAG: phosphatase PAP2 family protein [Planctomycetota bacterium]
MPPYSRPAAVAMRRCASPLRAVIVCAMLVASVAADGPSAAEQAAAKDVPGGMFLPVPDRQAFWERTLATVSAEWPVVRAVEPDFDALPPRDGVIESAWVEPRSAAVQPVWPPRRQRVVVRVIPAVGGAWIDATVQTESLSGAAADGSGVELVGGWRSQPASEGFATQLAASLAPTSDPVYSLPPLEQEEMLVPRGNDLPWSKSRFPRLSRAGHKVWQDYRNFYDCQSLVCTTAAFGAGALMANTGFDDTMQAAWLRGVEPTGLGTFFTGCKDIGEGRYALPIFGVAAATGLVFEGNPVGDVLGEWGSRSLRIFVVGAPPLYVLQMATGASRPAEDDGSRWHFWNDNNGVSGHAFVGAIPFLAAADMVESPLLKGTLYVCSTFVAFSRMTTDSHYPSQVFLGWYLAWASARAVDATELHFAGMEVQVVPVPIGDLGGVGVTTAW